MPSIKDLKKRIGSVKNTQQTTKAMKMVSAAKLRRAQDAILSQRPYAQRMSEMIRELAQISALGGPSGLADVAGGKFARHELAEGQRPKLLLVLVTSDRGLCGGFNGSIIKTAQRFMKSEEAAPYDVQLGFLGRKAFDYFKTKALPMGPNFSELSGKVTFAKAKKLSDLMITEYANGTYDEIRLIYNEFKNAVTQIVRMSTFLPIGGAQDEVGTEPIPAVGVTLVKPDPETVLNQLIEKNFPMQIFRIMLDSQASEHGARMSAMENATKNAGEMIKKLTLQYNKQRQAGITKELLEIIAGSESQKSA